MIRHHERITPPDRCWRHDHGDLLSRVSGVCLCIPTICTCCGESIRVLSLCQGCVVDWSGTNYKVAGDERRWFKNTSSMCSLWIPPLESLEGGILMSWVCDAPVISDGMSHVSVFHFAFSTSPLRDLGWKHRTLGGINGRASYSIRNNLIFHTIIKYMYQRLQTIVWKLQCKDADGARDRDFSSLTWFSNAWQYFTVEQLHFEQCLNLGLDVVHY